MKKPLLPLRETALLLCTIGGQYFIRQYQTPWTLALGFALFLLAAFCMAYTVRTATATENQIAFPYPFLFIGVTLAIALFLRIFRLDQFPAGIFPDEGYLALSAERMLHHQAALSFHSMFISPVCIPAIYYCLDAWFHLVSPSQIAFFLYAVIVSLFTLPILYYVYRQLDGPKTALFGLYLLATSRWLLTYSRDTHPAIEVPFYIGVVLALWFYSLKRSSTLGFILCGVFTTSSFYSYQDLKLLPVLMIIYSIYEARQTHDSSFLRKNLLMWLSFCVVALPAWLQMSDINTMVWREQELMVFPGLFIEKGWSGVFGHLLESFTTFNRFGDTWYYHNIPGYPLLDDVTGALWAIGFLGALFAFKKRENFYPLVAIFILFLPAFLSTDARHASRLMGTMPFILFLAARSLSYFHGKFSEWLSARMANILVVLLLACSGVQNAYNYFEVQAKNNECWRVSGGAETTWVAKKADQYHTQYTCFLCPKFHGNFQIEFLDYDIYPQFKRWQLPGSLVLKADEKRKGACLFFEEGQWGVLNLYQELYPGGTTETFKDLAGADIAALYLIPPAVLATHSSELERHPFSKGLKGTYYLSLQEKGKPAIVQNDPLLNFTFRNDFPVVDFPPLAIHWTGTVKVPATGYYEWTVLTSDLMQMTLDGKPVVNSSKTYEKLFLKKGGHRVDIHFLKYKGKDTVLNLLWKTPGSKNFEVVPAEAFRPY